MTDDDLAYVIDWELNKEAFARHIQDLILKMNSSGKVIPLPVEGIPGRAFLAQLSLLLSQVSCAGCSARCCRSNPCGDQEVPLMPGEYRKLSARYGAGPFKRGKECHVIPMPCSFLKEEYHRDWGFHGRCSIYADRPLVCVIFPFQWGGRIDTEIALSVSSDCSEGRRIAEAVYMASWELRRAFKVAEEKETR